MKTSIVITKTGNRILKHWDILEKCQVQNKIPVNEVHSRTFSQHDLKYDQKINQFLLTFGPENKSKTKGDKDYFDSGVKTSVEIRHFEDQVRMPLESNLGF